MKKVLVIDADARNRILWRETLSEEGFQAYASGLRPLRFNLRYRPDLVLLDADSFSVVEEAWFTVRRLRKALPGLVIIMMAEDAWSIMEHSFKIGVNACVPKAADSRDIVRMINLMLLDRQLAACPQPVLLEEASV